MKPEFSAGTCSSLQSTTILASRPDLDGYKLAKGMCLARKARDSVCLIVQQGVVKYSVF